MVARSYLLHEAGALDRNVVIQMSPRWVSFVAPPTQHIFEGNEGPEAGPAVGHSLVFLLLFFCLALSRSSLCKLWGFKEILFAQLSKNARSYPGKALLDRDIQN